MYCHDSAGIPLTVVRQYRLSLVGSTKRYRRPSELGETGLAELLMSVSSCAETLCEEYLARPDAHEALARLRVDAHELWAPAHQDHDR